MTLLTSMQETVRHELSEATVSYEEKPRDQWLFDFPAQVIVVDFSVGYLLRKCNTKSSENSKFLSQNIIFP